MTTVTGVGGNGGGLNLASVAHPSLQSAHGVHSTETVTPPPPQVSHSNLSQVARAHPYAAAASLPATPFPPSSVGLSRFTGQSSMPSSSGAYANSAPYNNRANEPLTFPLRSPPDRSGEYRRRLTLLPPHSGVPLEYGGVPQGSGGGSSNSAGGSASCGVSGSGSNSSSSSSITSGNSGINSSSRHLSLPPTTQSQMAAYSIANQPSDGYSRDTLVMPNLPIGESAHKKLRISGSESMMKTTIAQPLRIDTRPIMTVATAGPLTASANNRETRDQPAYIPQVEAISPTPDSPLRSTKDDLLQQITKVFSAPRCQPMKLF